MSRRSESPLTGIDCDLVAAIGRGEPLLSSVTSEIRESASRASAILVGTSDIRRTSHKREAAIPGADGDNVGARIAKALRRLDKSGTVDDRDELLESNRQEPVDEH